MPDAMQLRYAALALRPRSRSGWERKTPATLSYVHLSEDDTPDYGLALAVQRRCALPIATATSAFADGNYLKTNDDIAP